MDFDARKSGPRGIPPQEERGISFKDLKEILKEPFPEKGGGTAASRETEAPASDSAEIIYRQSIIEREKVINDLLEGKQPSLEPLVQVVTHFVEALSISSHFLGVSFSYSKDLFYPLFKSVNHAILAIKLGMGLEKYDKNDLIKLGVACLLSDVGIWKVPRELILKTGSLSPSEQAEVRRHPTYSGEMLKILPPEHQWLRTVAEQSHERENGSGYPRGLRGDEILEFAKIIGLVESYEAITHYRPYRPEGLRTPDAALKELINVHEFEGYSGELVKILVKQLSVFPPGSWVRLNTGEIGQVLESNSFAPLRPKVEVWIDASQKRLKNPKIIDLDKGLLVYITGCVNPAALPEEK